MLSDVAFEAASAGGADCPVRSQLSEMQKSPFSTWSAGGPVGERLGSSLLCGAPDCVSAFLWWSVCLNNDLDGFGPLLLAVWPEDIRGYAVSAEALPFQACGTGQPLASVSGQVCHVLSCSQLSSLFSLKTSWLCELLLLGVPGGVLPGFLGAGVNRWR